MYTEDIRTDRAQIDVRIYYVSLMLRAPPIGLRRRAEA